MTITLLEGACGGSHDNSFGGKGDIVNATIVIQNELSSPLAIYIGGAGHNRYGWCGSGFTQGGFNGETSK